MTIPKTLAAYALTGAALCAVLTGCKTETSQSPAPTPAAAPSTVQDGPGGLSDSDLYLTAARAVAPALEAVPDTSLVDLGQSVCSAFEAGATTAEVGATMITAGLGATESGAVVGAATSTLCPEYEGAARGA